MRNRSVIYTIGYHGLTGAHLIRILDEHKIELLVDVRTYPFSRYSEEFNRNRLQKRLGSRYIWKGNCLGGKSGHRQPRYAACLEWLAKISQERQICVMCMEADPTKCHRYRWIAFDLKTQFGVDAEHLTLKSLNKRQQRFSRR